MTAGNDFDNSEPAQSELFSALLTPLRSLNRAGFLVLMGFLSAVSFVAGLAFLLMGAWPVLGFFGLDVLAIYWAFRINFRDARATEEIRVTPSELRVRRVSHRGTWSNGCSIRCGCSSTRNATRNSVSKSFIWSRAAAGFRSHDSSVPTKKQALPKP